MVHFEKNKTGTQTRTLIAINKRVISTDIKKIGGGDFDWISKKGLTESTGLRSSNSRFKKAAVPQPNSPTVSGQHLAVDCLDRFDGEMHDFQTHERRRKSSEFSEMI